MTQGMKGVTKALVSMNKQINLPGLSKLMAEFMKENERSEVMQEAIGDTLDDAMADESSAAEEDAIVNQVLDELGVGMGQTAPEVPTSTLSSAQPAVTAAGIFYCVGVFFPFLVSIWFKLL